MSRRPISVLYVFILLASVALGQIPVRVATYNVQALGSNGSGQWNDAVSVLDRMGADVVGIQEIDGTADLISFGSFASQAGYPHFAASSLSGTLSGSLRNGVMSAHPITFSMSHSAADLSGDPTANDITRDIFEAWVQVPNAADVLGVFVVHLKASNGSTNDFRRAIEIIRLRQAIDGFQLANPSAPWIVMGDMNEDIGDGPFNNSFSSLPSGLPQTYDLGNDINFPVVYDPFNDVISEGSLLANATQEDSTTIDTTRNASGRRLDYLFYGGGTVLNGDEVYNSSRDNGIDDTPIGNWLMKVGGALPSGTSLNASDHYSVFGDFEIPTGASLLYPGTDEDFFLSTGINGTPTTGPGFDCKFATGFDVLLVNLHSPGATFDFQPILLVAQFFCAPGVPCSFPFPGFQFDPFDPVNPVFVLVDGLTGTGGFFGLLVPSPGSTFAFALPAGLGGQEIMFQGLATSMTAANGIAAFSEGHKLTMF